MRRGQTFRCLICGAETLVIRAGKEDRLRPVCCNQPMSAMKELAEIYRCPICGSEVAVLRLKSESIRLVCCNVPMQASVKRVA